VGTPDEIHFSIAGAGVHTISPTSALPTIIQPVIIDGYTQDSGTADPSDDAKPNTNGPGLANNAALKIELNGASAGDVNGLTITAGSSTVRGLVINRFATAPAFFGQGIRLQNDGGTFNGGNLIEGNFIGTDVTGMAASSNSGAGIVISFVSNNTVGGTALGAGNLISANGSNGIFIDGPSESNTVQGNFIGTDVTGTVPLGNESGIVMNSSGNNTIGGGTPAARNVISGNRVFGVSGTAPATPHLIQGNYIGTDVTGMAAVPNQNGVAAANYTVQGNVISGNSEYGMVVNFNNIVEGNLIGTNATGSGALGNGFGGITVQSAATGTIGGTTAGTGNTIAFNGILSGAGAGLVFFSTGQHVAILGNSIFSNTFGGQQGPGFGLGIDLGGNGVTPNDAGDPDTGPNNLQNFPEISSITRDGATGMLTVVYNVPSDPANSGYPLRVEFFNADADGQEGQTFLGFDTFTATDFAAGTKSFTFAPAAAVAVNDKLVATATDTVSVVLANTSEFSPNGTVQAPACSLIVTTTSDVVDANDSVNSLREAIICANSDPDLDTITFAIPGAGPHTINVGGTGLGGLPDITQPVVIDGRTQSGASCNTNALSQGSNAVLLIELNGAAAGGGVDGLRITAGGSTVRGLVINRFADEGIELRDVGGNLVECNYIGTDTTGNVDLGNASEGIAVRSPDNTIGGTAAAARNVISGNNSNGILIFLPASDRNLVQGNYIGTNAAGTADLGNTLDGVNIDFRVDNTIGGTAAEAGNVISGNNGHGIALFGDPGSPSQRTVIQGNLLGTNAAGTADLGNTSDGVFIVDSATNTIGGTAAGAGNLIGFNDLNGIQIQGASAQGNIVQGNLIGTNAAGANRANSGHGVLAIGSGPNEIGGTVAGAGNTIGNNGGDGVAVVFAAGASFFKFIRQNSIFGNSGIGIDLEDDGVTPNDAGDTDTGANDRYNFPILQSAIVNGGNLSLTGFARPGAAIELFIAAPDSSGFGEGRTFLTTLIEGSAADTDATTGTYGPGPINGRNQGTDTTNRFGFTIPTPAGVTAFTTLTATGTDTSTNTSEFSGNGVVSGPLDFGDAPDTYGTTLAANGAQHSLTGPFLGATRDGESDGQPTSDATGDGADEDGVTIGTLRQGTSPQITVVSSANFAELDGFFDWNGDGNFGTGGVIDPDELVFDSVVVNQGSNMLTISVPANAIVGTTFARFRLSSSGGLSFDGRPRPARSRITRSRFSAPRALAVWSWTRRPTRITPRTP